MTFLHAGLLNMKLKESSTLQLISELKRPNPPTPEMIARAQPFRGDVVNIEAIIKHPTHQIDV